MPIQAPEILNSGFHPGVAFGLSQFTDKLFPVEIENQSRYRCDMRKAPWHSELATASDLNSADNIVLPQTSVALKQQVAAAETVPVDPDIALKWQFAEHLLYNPHDKAGAARLVSGGDYAKQYFREMLWPSDLAVIEHQSKLLAEKGAAHFLPTKEKMVHRLWAESQIFEPKETINAIRLAAELAGYLNKAGEAGNAAQLVNQNITISFVSPKQEDIKVIEETAIEENANPLPNLKFVS